MGAMRTPQQAWVEAGLRALAAGGVDAVRVEALAKALGVTKGGFYGYFADRNALLAAMLDTWEREAVDDVLERVRREGGEPREQARLAGRLTFSADRLLPIDLAIRDWARRDDDVAARLRRVDNSRIEVLRTAIGSVYADPDEVEARCLLAFCAAIGRHLVAADHNGRTRDEVMTRAANLLLGIQTGEPAG